MLALWSVYIATWATVSGSGPAIVATWWLLGVGLFQAFAHTVTRPRATAAEPRTSSEQMPTGPGRGLRDAVQDWESEGGAIA
jgi:hypothetical protein